jgi:HSP20 family protein
MTSSSERREDEEPRGMMPRRGITSDNFRREMERMRRKGMMLPWPFPDEERMARPWSFPMDWQQFPSTTTIPEARDMRMALYELADRGDKFELQVEVPGIEKEKIDLKATKYSIEISGKHSEKTEEKTEEKKGKRYLYTERLYRSFYRNVTLPEEIVPSKVAAKVENGVLKVDLPKKIPTKSGEGEATKIDVK